MLTEFVYLTTDIKEFHYSVLWACAALIRPTAFRIISHSLTQIRRYCAFHFLAWELSHIQFFIKYCSCRHFLFISEGTDRLRYYNPLKWMRKWHYWHWLQRGASVFDEGLHYYQASGEQTIIRSLYHVKGGGRCLNHIFCVTQHICKVTWKQVSSEYCSAKHR